MVRYMIDEILYILMRDDMDSLNPGKGMAQSAHASNIFMIANIKDEGFRRWAGERGFGITIVLAANIEQIHAKYGLAKKSGFKTGLVRDTSYPLTDGDTLHLLDIVTCGYIFGNKEDLISILGDLELYK